MASLRLSWLAKRQRSLNEAHAKAVKEHQRLRGSSAARSEVKKAYKKKESLKKKFDKIDKKLLKAQKRETERRLRKKPKWGK